MWERLMRRRQLRQYQQAERRMQLAAARGRRRIRAIAVNAEREQFRQRVEQLKRVTP
jgi:hypothetical protein